MTVPEPRSGALVRGVVMLAALESGMTLEEVGALPEAFKHEVTTMKIVLLNGPPRSGKDSAGRAISLTVAARVEHVKFAWPLKNATHALYGMPDISADFFESTKDEPNPVFFGLTPREAYIKVSEEMVKPSLGVDFFGRVCIATLRGLEAHVDLSVITDCGFATETRLVIKQFGPENVLLIRLHREGRTFARDSRSYLHLSDSGITEIDLDNNGTDLEAFEAAARCAVYNWLKNSSP